MRPAIDLVYRANVRAATEIPDGADQRARGASEPVRLEPQRGPLAARAPLALAQPRRSANAPRPRRPPRSAGRRRSGARGRAGHRGRELEQQRAQQVGEHDHPAGRPLGVVRATAARSRAQVEAAHLDRDAVDRGVLARRRRRSRARCRGRAPARSRAARRRSRARPSRCRRRAAAPRRRRCAASSSSSSRHRRVLACAPVPNAWPGSITISCTAPAASALGGLPRRPHAQRGHARCPPARGAALRSARGGGTRFQRSCQSSAISLVEISTSASPATALQVGQRRQLAGRAVDGVLDDVRRRAATSSTPAGASSSSSASTSSACSRRDAHGEADHAAWLPSARRSLANIDSCERRFSSREAVVELLEQLALLRRQAARARRR